MPTESVITAQKSTSPLFRSQSLTVPAGQTEPDILPIAIPRFGWYTACFCGVFVVIALLVTVFGTYRHRERVQGSLEFKDGQIEIRTPGAGTIKQIFVKRHQHVVKGQKIALLQRRLPTASGSDSLENQEKLLIEQKRHLQIQLDQARHVAAEKNQAFKVTAHTLTERKAFIDRKIEINQRLLDSQTALLKSMSTLKELSAISTVEYNLQSEKLENLRTARFTLRNEAFTNAQDQSALSHERAEHAAEQNIRLAGLEKEILEVETSIERGRSEREYLLVAPRDGVIASSSAMIGATVQSADSMFVLIPETPTLVASLYVPDRATPYLALGGDVNIRYAAYPYEKFGQFRGTIRSIATLPSTDTTTNQHRYKVVVAIDNQFVKVENHYQPLKAGYQLEADLMGEERTLLAWLFEPVLAVRSRTD